MSKQTLINIIGRIFVDEDFRNEYYNNRDQTLDGISDLTNEEKQTLRDFQDTIKDCANTLDIKYESTERKVRR